MDTSWRRRLVFTGDALARWRPFFGAAMGGENSRCGCVLVSNLRASRLFKGEGDRRELRVAAATAATTVTPVCVRDDEGDPKMQHDFASAGDESPEERSGGCDEAPADVRARRARPETPSPQSERSRALRGPLRSGRACLRPSRRLRRAFPADARAHRVAAPRRRHVPGAAAGVSRSRDARASGVAARRGLLHLRARRGSRRDEEDETDETDEDETDETEEPRTKMRDDETDHFGLRALGACVRTRVRVLRRSPLARAARTARGTGFRLPLVSVSFVPFSRLARVRARDAAPLRDALVRGHRAHERLALAVGAADKKTTDANDDGLFGALSFVRRARRRRRRRRRRRGAPACCWGNASVSPATAKISSISSPRKTTLVARRRRASPT